MLIIESEVNNSWWNINIWKFIIFLSMEVYELIFCNVVWLNMICMYENGFVNVVPNRD